MRLFWISAAAVALTLILHGPADAQQAWEIERSGQNQLSASVTFSSGQVIALRCAGQQVEAVVIGLPSEAGPQSTPPGIVSRTIEVIVDGRRMPTSLWLSPDPATAFFAHPAALARSLRSAQELVLRVVPKNGPATQIVLDLPRDRQGLEAIFKACELATIDPRDDAIDMTEAYRRGTPPVIEWATTPQANYPSAAQANNVTAGLAIVSCLADPTGRLSDCRAEFAAPQGYGFGDAAVTGMRRARIKPLSGAESRPVLFTTRFRLQ